MAVTKRQEEYIGYVEINNPPENVINQSVRRGLLEAVRWAEKEMLSRVILTANGTDFSAGADALEFDQSPQAPHLADVTAAIDESFVPWVAVIEGEALGSAAEIAMACRMRIMAPNAVIGVPDVDLGIIPSAGGTQRLPRLVGLAKAVDLIAGGQSLSAQEAFTAGLVQEIDEDPLEAAYLVNTEDLGCIVPAWELPAPAADSDFFTKAREAWATDGGNAAPGCAIDVIEQGLTQPFHDALALEKKTYAALRDSAAAKALRHVYFAERGAQAAG
ncbi:MAG: enoyl-CoA hydratase/isomerase family protein [Pseudomonadota bacterium]